MTNQEIEGKVLDLIKLHAQTDQVITHEQRIEQLIPDSLEQFELDVAIEEAFDLKTLQDDFFGSRQTVGQLIRYVQLSKNDALQFEIERQVYLKELVDRQSREMKFPWLIFVFILIGVCILVWFSVQWQINGR